MGLGNCSHGAMFQDTWLSVYGVGITCLAAHSDGVTVITGSEDNTARLSNAHTSRVLGSFTGACSCRWARHFTVLCVSSMYN